jgi:hypothetical protein
MSVLNCCMRLLSHGVENREIWKIQRRINMEN